MAGKEDDQVMMELVSTYPLPPPFYQSSSNRDDDEEEEIGEEDLIVKSLKPPPFPPLHSTYWTFGEQHQITEELEPLKSVEGTNEEDQSKYHRISESEWPSIITSLLQEYDNSFESLLQSLQSHPSSMVVGEGLEKMRKCLIQIHQLLKMYSKRQTLCHLRDLMKAKLFHLEKNCLQLTEWMAALRNKRQEMNEALNIMSSG